MADIGKKATFQIGDGEGSEGFTTVADVISLDAGGIAWDQEEDTPHDGGDPRKTFSPTIADEGTVVVGVKYNPANSDHTTLKGRANGDPDNDLHNYRINGPHEKRTFAAFLVSAVPELTPGGLIKMTYTFKKSGKDTVEAPD